MSSSEQARATMAQQVLAEIRRHQRFVVTTHARPDGDGVASSLACKIILLALGKQVDVVLYDPVPRNYRNLAGADSVRRANSVDQEFDAAILLECDSLQRSRLQGFDGKFLINIDHHASGRPFASVNWIDASAAATAELIYQLARESRIPMTSELATCIYTGLVTDTGSFMFEGTDEHTFTLARELVLAGAEPARVARSVYFSHSTAKVRLLGAALSNLHREGDLAWIWVTREQMNRAGAIEEDCEGLVNYALAVHGVEVSVFFREQADGRFRVSVRSKSRVDVGQVAEKLGGGGHRCASGLSVDGPLADAVARVIGALRLAASVQ
jgi:bifunctional oligoribonuclease and PAP phosphatase NrnA